MAVVGVTGHRVLTEIDKIEAGVTEALTLISKRFHNQPLTILSSLAEGGDRIVARAVLQQEGSRLIAVLPMCKSEYLTDFESTDSKLEVLEFLNQAHEVIELPFLSSRETAYEAAGKYIVEHCNLLLAIWDGRPAQGQGGTGDIVALARGRKRPIAWVHAGNRKPGTIEPTSLGKEQGVVTLEIY